MFGIGWNLVFGLAAIQFRAKPRTSHPRDFFQEAIHSANSGLQLDPEIALSGSSSEGPAPFGFFSLVEDALKRRVT